jgi:DNA-binding transcriptional LysR family regulator
MDFRDLKYFEVIATEGSLGRAAEKLHRTQPALTKCIDRLEEGLGSRLFEKDGRGMRLTPAGHILLKRSRQMTVMVDETSREMKDYADGLQGEVRLGCAPTLAQHLMPVVFGRLLSEAPHIGVKLTVATNDSLLDGLLDGELDLVVGPMLDNDADFECERIAEDTVVVMARQGHPVFGAPRTLADLLAYKWLLPPTTVASRQWLDQTFQRNGLARPQVQVESNMLSLTLPMLETTPLLSFVTRHHLTAGRLDIREVDVPAAQLHRALGLTWRRHGYLSPLATRVADILRAHGKDLLAV